MNVSKYTVDGTECGDLYRIKNRRADVIITREMAGGIGKTKKLANRHKCGLDSFFQVEISDGLYLGLCKRHAKEIEAVPK